MDINRNAGYLAQTVDMRSTNPYTVCQPRRLAVGGGAVGLKKRHAGSLQTEVEHVEVGDRGMKKPGAGVRGGGLKQ